jgi:DNA repair exonuclease SbcCD nuclease subunit
MKFAHLADVHLGYEQYNQSWRAEDYARVFRQAAEIAVSNRVDFAIIAGDLFHRSVPNPKTIKEAIDILSIFRKNRIPVFAVEGNHDKSMREVSIYHLLESLGLLNVVGLRKRRVESEYLTSLRVGENAYLVKGVFDNVEIIGDRHRTKWQLEKVLQVLKPETDESVVVLHQSVKEVVDIEIDLAYELTLQDLPKASYYAMGHVHVPKVYEYKGSYVVYPGSLERYDAREASIKISYSDTLRVEEGMKKGFFIVEDFTPRFVEVEARDLFNIYVEAADANSLKEKFRSVLSRVNSEGILVARLVCEDSANIKTLNEMALEAAKHAEIRFEVLRRDVDRIEVKSEQEFFTPFELQILEYLRNFDENRDLVVELVKKHFGLIRSVKEDGKSEISGGEDLEEDQPEQRKKDEEKIEREDKPVKPLTLLDFVGGEKG